MFLPISKNGSTGWRFKYRYKGEEKQISFGVYPEVSIDEARERRLYARKHLKEGIDPSAVRKAEKLAAKQPDGSFEVVARDWPKSKHAKEVSAGHAKTTLRRLESWVFPWVGNFSVTNKDLVSRTRSFCPFNHIPNKPVQPKRLFCP